MATIVVISILAVACIFMVYVLIEFHLETKRPRHATYRFPKGVVAFRNGFTREATETYRQKVSQSKSSAVDTAAHERLLVLPVGIRRLGAKHIKRS